MVYAYLRVSTVLQDSENQRFEILKFADEKKLVVDEWISETVSGMKSYKERKLGKLIDQLQKSDILLISEISRLGRNLMEILVILNLCLEKEVELFSCKERLELGKNNLNSQIIAFCFSLSASIERQLISQRTREALARKKQEGVILGRKKGCLSRSKLDPFIDRIRELVSSYGVSKSSVAKIYQVSPGTVSSFLITRKIDHHQKDSDKHK